VVDILIAFTFGLKGMAEALGAVFPHWLATQQYTLRARRRAPIRLQGDPWTV